MLRSEWGEVQPRAAEQDAYLASHTWDDYAAWHLGLTEGPVAVERNREVVPRAQHETTELVENDVIEIVHFVGGG